MAQSCSWLGEGGVCLCACAGGVHFALREVPGRDTYLSQISINTMNIHNRMAVVR